MPSGSKAAGRGWTSASWTQFASGPGPTWSGLSWLLPCRNLSQYCEIALIFQSKPEVSLDKVQLLKLAGEYSFCVTLWKMKPLSWAGLALCVAGHLAPGVCLAVVSRWVEMLCGSEAAARPSSFLLTEPQFCTNAHFPPCRL